jgi:hypothetical protein
MDKMTVAHLVALIAIAVFLVGPAFLSTNRSMPVMMRNLALWLGIAVVISLAYRWMG